MVRSLMLIVVVALVAALIANQPASAAISENTIDPSVSMSLHGRRLTVTGPINCTAGETLSVRITVTQNVPSAWGEGMTLLRCTGALQHWSVNVMARGAESFHDGDGQACALGMTRDRATITETRQWCAVNGVTLVSIQ